MIAFVPLFAVDAGEVIRLLVILFIFLVPVIGKLLAKAQQIPPPNRRPVPPQPDVADEIEAFMRRAAERHAAKGQRATVVQASPAPAKPVKAEPVRAQAVVEKPVGGQVSAHVQKYLDKQEFTRREKELGKEVVEADRQIDQHMQQVFDHRVSKLEAVPGEAAAAPVAYAPPDLVGAAADIPDTFATGLLELITNPDSLRQAIVLSEILHRPEERWG
jgi:hypothetical protein